MSPVPDDSEDESSAERPSKSARKRAAHEAQDLGEILIGLRDAELDALELPEALADAVREGRKITSRGAGGRGAGARQKQYIGKLMRDLDLEPIRAALNARGEVSAREAAKFKRLEEWRERLIVAGAGALQELERGQPGLQRAVWEQRIGAAQTERARTGAIGPAGRELFRALRDLLDRDQST